jgi:hypothetical protein
MDAAEDCAGTRGRREDTCLQCALIRITIRTFRGAKWTKDRSFIHASLLVLEVSDESINFFADFVFNWLTSRHPPAKAWPISSRLLV